MNTFSEEEIKLHLDKWVKKIEENNNNTAFCISAIVKEFVNELLLSKSADKTEISPLS